MTTFRRDIETDGRHATVAFSTSIDQDAARRDFTMNALYADAAGYVIDPLGGLPDVGAHLPTTSLLIGLRDHIASAWRQHSRWKRFFVNSRAALGLDRQDSEKTLLCRCGADPRRRAYQARKKYRQRTYLPMQLHCTSLSTIRVSQIFANENDLHLRTSGIWRQLPFVVAIDDRQQFLIGDMSSRGSVAALAEIWP